MTLKEETTCQANANNTLNQRIYTIRMITQDYDDDNNDKQQPATYLQTEAIKLSCCSHEL
jgi:hypothetical protein